MTLKEIIFTSISSSLMIIFAAFYAIFYGFYREKKKKNLLYLGYLFYTLLIISTYILASLLSLEGFWVTVMLIVLSGYWFAPKLIWRLSDEVKNRNYSGEQ